MGEIERIEKEKKEEVDDLLLGEEVVDAESLPSDPTRCFYSSGSTIANKSAAYHRFQ